MNSPRTSSTLGRTPSWIGVGICFRGRRRGAGCGWVTTERYAVPSTTGSSLRGVLGNDVVIAEQQTQIGLVAFG